MDKLIDLIAKSLMLPADKVTEDLKYNSIPEWDSVAHMALVTELEDAYGIMLETDDIVGMSSVAKIREILSKYDAAA
ncbi:acyl carrier protein [Sphingobium sp. DEHP117]|jgi:acyl carrier protein|uniref:acyl carrier protein n=1 Tax=Sphingobium sp. DEHP117 TaxID=2993436 RepID=UPI0027D59355|nr:phosphopantetheine-binding protein [Sphingobium sp. DEHP117]MDQ4421044.1 acyl carrier protein [Sphingobium sp. DEHP117]